MLSDGLFFMLKSTIHFTHSPPKRAPMNTAQSAIVPDHCKSGIFIEADAQGSTDAIKQACVQSLDALADLQTQFPDASLGLTLAFGSRLWQSFGHNEEGREIKPFKALGGGLAPATQHDVLIHIQSLRHDLSIALAEKVLAAFGSSISVADETHSHRLLEERGFDGFVDGTENPQDEKRAEVAVIAEGADADVCVWDPKARWTISAATQHQAVDYTPLEGFGEHGRAKVVFVNGVLVARDGEPTGAQPGRYVPR